MSEKGYEALTKIHQVYGKIYGFEWYYYILLIFWVVSLLISILGLCSSILSLNISFIFITINVLLLGVIFYLTNKKRKFIITARIDTNMVKKMKHELNKINIASLEQLNLVITEIDEVENEQKEKSAKASSIVSKIFFFTFWIPLGFFMSHFITNSEEALLFSEIRTLLIYLLVISIQIIVIALFGNFILSEVLAIADTEKRKRIIARRYINDIKYLKLNNQL